MRKQVKSFAKRATCFTVAAAMAALFVPGTALAYDRYEHATMKGGTQVTVYSGTVNGNDKEPYLDAPNDYLKSSSFETPMTWTSDSNITTSTNFVKKTAGTPAGTGVTVQGGVKGVTWDNKTNTLTLDNVEGTVLTIEGDSIDPTKWNTYNNHLDTIIDLSVPGLTRWEQFDNFVKGDDTQVHQKDNTIEQDTVTVRLVGKNKLSNIAAKGNVKIVFTGTGTLDLDAKAGVSYNDYHDPSYDTLSDTSDMAVCSQPTIGYAGKLADKVEKEGDTMPNGMKRVNIETYEYNLPEFALADDVKLVEGGEINNSKVIDGVDYFVYTGKDDPTKGEPVAEKPEGLTKTYTLNWKGGLYNLVYNDDATAFFVKIDRDPMMGRHNDQYFDVTGSIEKAVPFASYIGTAGKATSKVSLQGTPKAETAPAADKPAKAPAKAAAKKAVTKVTINKATVSKKVVKKAIGKNAKTVTKVVLGKKVKKISKSSFKGTKVKTIEVKSKKLTKKNVKGSLKSSKVKTVKVPKAKKKAYKKYFAKSNCGKSVTVK